MLLAPICWNGYCNSFFGSYSGRFIGYTGSFFALKLGKRLFWLLVNSFVVLVILVLINFLPSISIEINVWRVLIVALGVIPGLLLVVALSSLGIAF